MTSIQIPRPKIENPTQWLVKFGLMAAVWTAWLWLFSPTLRYLSHIFTIEDFRTNQLLLLGIIGLTAYRWFERKQTFLVLETRKVSHRLPILLVLGSMVGWLAVERWLAINTVSATLFGLGSYGLLGLSLDQRRWRQGFPAALLLIGTLPFGAHIETFLGYPLRIMTAQIVGDGLSAAGFGSIGIDTILIFENGVSKIDLPCSGVQSLWTGSLFFLAATWLENKKLGIRWLISLMAFAVTLIVANTARVAILVLVGEALGFHFAAELLHVPLGVLGFVAACAVALAMLRHFVPVGKQLAASELVDTASCFPTNVFSVLLVMILIAGFFYSAKPITGLTAETQKLQFPAELQLEAQPLKPDEQAWLTKDGADSAERYRFEWPSADGPRTGTMILISSRSWRAHHRPERCFEVYGLDVNDSGTHLVNPSALQAEPMPIRQVNLGDQNGTVSYRAVYWFQSADTITDDYGSRLWADVAQPNTRWMLVSVLFDENYPADDAGTESFYLMLKNSVDQNLNTDGTATR